MKKEKRIKGGFIEEIFYLLLLLLSGSLGIPKMLCIAKNAFHLHFVLRIEIKLRSPKHKEAL